MSSFLNTLPIKRETQEHVITFHSVLGVYLMQPLGNERYALTAQLLRPQQPHAEIAVGAGKNIATTADL
jgi:hypothetical protein